MTKKPATWQISIAFVCVILGALLVAQLRTQQSKGPYAFARLDALADLYKQSEDQRERLEKEVVRLRAELTKVNEGQRSATTLLSEELRKVQILAGLTPVQGPGLLVTLDDSDVKAAQGENADMYLIHYEDLLLVINELFAAGAEAVSINGQRMSAISEVRCAGPTILVNNTRITPPFVISAIGDPKVLRSSLEMRGGVLEPMKPWGIKIKLEESEKLVLPAYKGTLNFEYARVVSGKEE